MPKSNVDAFTSGMKAIDDNFKEAMKDEKARKDHIIYELNNHEAYYTRDITSTLEALGEDFTREEVLQAFDGRRKESKVNKSESGMCICGCHDIINRPKGCKDCKDNHK